MSTTAGQLRAERVTDLPGRRQAVGHHFGAGQQQLDHRLALHQQVVVAGQGGQGQVRGVEGGAGLDQHVPGRGFLARFPDVLAVLRLAGAGAAADHQDGQPVVVLAQDARFRCGARPWRRAG